MSRKPKNQPASGEYVEDVQNDAVIGVALVGSLVVFGLLAAGGGVAFWLLVKPAPEPETAVTELADVELRAAPTVELPRVPFTDITRQAGIQFVHENGAYGDKLLPETMGGGAAFLDFDGDGDQDLLLVNSRRWDWDPRGASSQPPTCRLYRNDGTGQFQDVTPGSGLEQPLYGMGVAAGDYDNDGRVDLFISAVGGNRLYHNEGEGKFREVTEEAMVAGGDDEWSSSCGWFDYDRDGDLDLLVCNYVRWSRDFDAAQNFQLTGGGRAYGRPQNFEGTYPYLYRNDGGGRFTEVAADAGLHVRNPDREVPLAKSLGLTFADFDRDGWLDIFIANDTVQNLMFHNERNGTFRETGVTAGIAFDVNGDARGAMGIDAAHFRDHEAFGIAIGNFATEMTALYVSRDGQLLFVDEANSSGLGAATRPLLTFGVAFLDIDLDGRLDLLAANGHLEQDINRVQPSQHYEQSPQLFWNCGTSQVTEFVPLAAAQCGEDFLKPMVGRAAAFADIDGDGDLDVLITTSGQSPRLLRNDQASQHHWLRIQLVGTTANRDAIGAELELKLGDRIVRRPVMPTRSYLTQVELPVTFGLGDMTSFDSLTVRWPDGSSEVHRELELDRLHRIEQPAAAARNDP